MECSINAQVSDIVGRECGIPQRLMLGIAALYHQLLSG